MNKQERQNRIIARGEHSNHSHVITGNATIERNENGEILVTANDNSCVLKHLLETEWIEGNEVWTKEHKDIPLKKGTYKFIQQQEYNPFDKIIQKVKD